MRQLCGLVLCGRHNASDTSGHRLPLAGDKGTKALVCHQKTNERCGLRETR